MSELVILRQFPESRHRPLDVSMRLSENMLESLKTKSDLFNSVDQFPTSTSGLVTLWLPLATTLPFLGQEIRVNLT